MNPLDILKFLTPDFSDLLQASFFGVMLAMLSLTVLSVSITAAPRAWEKKWNHASNAKSSVSQGIDQGSVTDLFHIVATRPEKLAEVMPGMLLIVGLLGTFIGLGLALDKASSILGASSAMDAAGAADGLQNMLSMLKGLGTKFKTSTWGIAGFILMKVWSEVTQFEEKRLAWVIGKVKKETEVRNALLVEAEKEKWKKLVQLGSTMTSELATAFEKGIEKTLQAASQNNRELVTKNAESLAAQTAALSEQQNQIAQNNANTMREMIAGQAAVVAWLDSQALTAQQIANERSKRAEVQLTALHQQQATLAQQNMHTMTELFANQTKALNEQHSEDMRENTRLIELLGENMQRVADASQQTNAAMQDFTGNTQTVVSNMDSAAQRMATGADNVGTAAQDLLGAVSKFEQQFTEVLDNVRTDLGQAISEMSLQATQTLEIGSQKLSDSTIQISKSLEKLSNDVTETMTDVRESIESALQIQRNASEEIIASSKDFREGIHEITGNIEKLATPIENGLAAISKSNVQMKTAISKAEACLESTEKTNENISELIEKIAHFGDTSQTKEKITKSLEPLKEIQTLLNDVCNHLSNRPTTEAGVAREIKENITGALMPLKNIQSLLTEMHSNLADRPVPQPCVTPAILLRDLSQQIQQAFTDASIQKAFKQEPAPSVAPSE